MFYVIKDTKSGGAVHICRSIHVGAEHAGLENAGPNCTILQGMKTQYWKTWYQTVGVENAGLENVGPMCRGGKCGTGKRGNELNGKCGTTQPCAKHYIPTTLHCQTLASLLNKSSDDSSVMGRAPD